MVYMAPVIERAKFTTRCEGFDEQWARLWLRAATHAARSIVRQSSMMFAFRRLPMLPRLWLTGRGSRNGPEGPLSTLY